MPHRAFSEGVTAVVVVTTGKVALTETNVLKVLEQRPAKFKLSKLVLLPGEPPRKVQKNLLRETYSDLYSR